MSLPRLLLKASAPIFSIFLILAGIIQLRAQMWTPGIICVLLAMAGFIYSARLLEDRPFSDEEVETLRPWVAQMALWTIVFSLLAVAFFYTIDNFVSPETNRIAAVAWVSSVLLAWIVVWRTELHRGRFRLWLEQERANRTELLLLLAVLMLAFVLRTLYLSNHPYPWSGDEASVGKEARRILSGEVTNFFDTGWSSQPNWSFVPTAIANLLLGDNILAVRITSVLAGTLAVLFVYLAGRELFNPAIGLMAAAFLATLPYNLHFSRIGVQNVVDGLMSSCVFWLLARAMKTDDPRYYYSAGAIAGLTIYTYIGTRLVLILAVVVLGFLVVRQRGYFLSHRRHLFLFFLGSLISAAPQAAFFARHPLIFIGRMGQEGIFLNGWLQLQAAQTGKSMLEILWNQFTRTVMVFVASPALGNFFNSPAPYLTVFASVLFLLGMGYALAYLLKPQHFILLLWFWAVVFFGGILTLNPPANTRLVMTTPVLGLFMALGAYKISEYLQKFRLLPARILLPLLFLTVAVIAYQNIRFYMFEYRNNMYFQDANGEFAMEVGMMAKTLDDDVPLFILGEPRVNSGIPTISYIAPNNPRVDLPSSSVPTFELAPDQPVAFFAIPETQVVLAELRQKYPGGQGGLVYRKTRPDELLFEYYVVQAK
jgi:4-amino-4-deoxy-L-arabinose transferase-like glycosyltransferase